MRSRVDISLVISTYNRAELLRDAIDSVCSQEPGTPSFELIVVDNNSTDATAAVVQDAIRTAGDTVVYVFEGQQGASHGRNAGIARAGAPIIAFADDDVRASADAVSAIKHAFDQAPAVCFVGDKVLPRWPREPPCWSTADQWSPLALATTVTTRCGSTQPTLAASYVRTWRSGVKCSTSSAPLILRISTPLAPSLPWKTKSWSCGCCVPAAQGSTIRGSSPMRRFSQTASKSASTASGIQTTGVRAHVCSVCANASA